MRQRTNERTFASSTWDTQHRERERERESRQAGEAAGQAGGRSGAEGARRGEREGLARSKFASRINWPPARTWYYVRRLLYLGPASGLERARPALCLCLWLCLCSVPLPRQREASLFWLCWFSCWRQPARTSAARRAS